MDSLDAMAAHLALKSSVAELAQLVGTGDAGVAATLDAHRIAAHTFCLENILIASQFTEARYEVLGICASFQFIH